MSFPRQGSGTSLQDYISGVEPQTIEADQFDVTDLGQILGSGYHPLNDPSDAGDGTERIDDPAGVTTQAGAPEGTEKPLQGDIEAERQARLAAEQRARELEQAQQEQARQAAQQEHLRIQSAINSIPDPETRRAKQLEYDNYRLTIQAQQQREQVQRLQQQQEQQAIRSAKAMVITNTMLTNQLPAHVRPLLEAATSPEHLDVLVASLKQMGVSSAQAQPTEAQQRMQQRLESGADIAGGAVGSAAIPEGPKKRSGDIIGLIQSTPYQRAVLREN